MDNLTLEIKENIAYITFDLLNEKVNKLSFQVLDEFDKYLEEIKNQNLSALLISSNKKDIFIAGADIKEIEAFENEHEVYQKILRGHEIFKKLENLNFPTISYVNGACMGGGLELALSCDYIVASTNKKTKLAFPEIKLGFFPGLGGTLRAPKKIGLIKALELILSGKSLDARKAYKISLVDEIFDDGQKDFKLNEFIQKVINKKVRKRKISFLNKLFENFSVFRELVFYKTLQGIQKKVNRDYNAPYMALEVIKQSYGKSIDEGIYIEAQAFSKLAITKESKYMIELFFTFEKLNKDFIKTSNPILNASVIGNGVMGKGIIWLFSKYLKSTRIKVRDLSQVNSIIKHITKLYSFSIKRRTMSKNQLNFKLNNLSYTSNYEGMQNSDIVLEAILEDETIKKQTFKELEKILKTDAIIASNTSSISIEKLSSDLKNKENFLGVHFFNPVNLMPLVEIIPNSQTSKETINKVKQMLITCGKTPIIVGDCAGFIVNRILLPYLNEAAFILSEGSNIHHIDKVLKDFGMPMGPFRLADKVGIDVGYKVAKILNDSYKERMPIAPILQRAYIDLKLLGEKNKKGFYIYEKNDLDENEEITKPYNINRQFTNEQIIQRCMYIMVNEASRCLEEKVVNEASTINFAMITGTGFPAYKGGILNYANDIGLENILNTLNELYTRYGKRFKPSNLLQKLVSEKKNFKTGETLWKS